MKPGYPIEKNDFTNVLSISADSYSSLLYTNGKLDDSFSKVFDQWHTNVKLVFLNYILKFPTESENIQNVYSYLNEKIFQIEAKKYNAEVKFLWYTFGLRLKKDEIVEFMIENILKSYGRMKYLTPLYKDLALNFGLKKALLVYDDLK
jgi:hypothetical protein